MKDSAHFRHLRDSFMSRYSSFRQNALAAHYSHNNTTVSTESSTITSPSRVSFSSDTKTSSHGPGHTNALSLTDWPTLPESGTRTASASSCLRVLPSKSSLLDLLLLRNICHANDTFSHLCSSGRHLLSSA
eukprot:scaffold324_cov188-Alexandrium_tamarense.AAC.5